MRFSTSLALLLAFSATAFADPDPAHEAQRQAATKAYDVGDWQQVIAATSPIIEANPKDNIALHLRGSARIELAINTRDAVMIREGISDARTAISVATTPEFNYYLPYLYGMTNLTRIEDQSSHAQVAVDIADQLLPQAGITAEQKSNVLYQRALAKAAMKQTDAAVADFNAALVANPKHIASYMAMADLYAEVNRIDEAIQTYGAAIKAFPEESLVYNNLGMLYQNSKRYNEAVRAFSAALQKNPKFDVALTNRGYTWLQGGKPAEAEQDFAASLQLNPNQPAVQSLLGTARLVQGRWQDAARDFELIIQKTPTDVSAHVDAGFARYFGKDYAGAILEFNKVVQMDTSAQFINPWRVWTLIRSGRKAEATGIAQGSRSRAEKERNWIDWVILFNIGDITGEELITHVETSDPNTQTAQMCEARYFIAEHQLAQGNNQDAATNYEQALRTNKRELSAWRGASYALRRFQ
ncbi:MAG: tetratricopeptide repeat protein [Planctomycetota bacterium]|nr:tetratricopeptide repeat protein [Planctomycetota bacterium]MDA1162895.1 tetratricopeptide repeat protein [Planctomycetota bacterium]